MRISNSSFARLCALTVLFMPTAAWTAPYMAVPEVSYSMKGPFRMDVAKPAAPSVDRGRDYDRYRDGIRTAMQHYEDKNGGIYGPTLDKTNAAVHELLEQGPVALLSHPKKGIAIVPQKPRAGIVATMLDKKGEASRLTMDRELASKLRRYMAAGDVGQAYQLLETAFDQSR